MLRMADQLMNIAYGKDAITGEAVEAPVKHETMVQDIKRGDEVMCPARLHIVRLC